MASIIGYRIKVTLNDSRTLVGQMLAFDKHMNLVISECEEFRRVKPNKKAKGAATTTDDDDGEEEMKRTLGLVILRGETIVTLSVEGPPPAVDESKGPSVRSLSRLGRSVARQRDLIIVPRLHRLERGLDWVLPRVVEWVSRRRPCELRELRRWEGERPLSMRLGRFFARRRQAPQSFAPPPGMPGMM
jgi:small nuclear ribonucleoprotein B and B'